MESDPSTNGIEWMEEYDFVVVFRDWGSIEMEGRIGVHSVKSGGARRGVARRLARVVDRSSSSSVEDEGIV